MLKSNGKGREDKMLERKDNKANSKVQEYFHMSEVDLRDLCRHQIDSFEHWTRRLIDEKMKEEYGAGYFELEIQSGNDEQGNTIMQPLIKKSIIDQVEGRMATNPERFSRKIDALVFDDITYFFCRDDFYQRMFKNILETFFSGKNEVRSVLDRVVRIRNKLSHGNVVSIREAEQVVCYMNDFIDVFKRYYQQCGREKDFNVPVFIRLKDSTGNDVVRQHMDWYPWEIHEKPIDNFTRPKLRAGDTYKAWVEVDGSYDVERYTITWEFKCGQRTEKFEGNEMLVKFGVHDVASLPEIKCVLTTDKEWHRRREKGDDELSFRSELVLPPIEDCY
ncbi:MAG: hypothetical protein RR071_08890 [Lachnospiraceae bacterium]